MGVRRSQTESGLLAEAKRLLPGGSFGVWSLPADLQLVVAYGKGSRLYDISGNEYVDYVLGSGPLILGHGHPVVTAAVRKQIELGSTFYLVNDVAIRLAQEITSAVPGAERLRFTVSGTEATMTALHLARAYTRREKVVKFEGAYHGHHDYGLLSANPSKRVPFPEAVPDSAGIPRSVQKEVLVAPFNDIQTTTHIMETYGDEVAAIIVEPLQRFIAPRPGFLEGLRSLCEDSGAVLIFDEVVTGFRLAYGGAQEYFGVRADLVVLGKIIGGGYPLAAVCGKADILDLCSPEHRGYEDYVFHSGTLSGNPVAAAAGLATLQELKRPGTYEALHSSGRRLRERLREVVGISGVPAQVVGEGPAWHIVFSTEEIKDYRSCLSEDKALHRQFNDELIRHGILVHHGVRSYMSLVHTDEDFDRTVVAVAQTLSRLKEKTT